jgi:ABC-type Mn2+/Zn2+ transport system permease subunit
MVSSRNLVWAAAVAVVIVVVGLAVSWMWGVVAGVVVLVISEVYERNARAKRRRARAGDA